ncbi:hypothetical protein EI983_14070 [Roseovarius faecimaris]|uniref:Uncharacterized protein n=1 Tax=Roseovarius faecimaris TaxID=2494550 RepID=A0A6I6IRG7_9RHOB|nr:hypothetical protein [Roseovarius faecimaris]QGX99325.1 hypothetical protein EI983_14070 [Roseovarius faecimaris]
MQAQAVYEAATVGEQADALALLSAVQAAGQQLALARPLAVSLAQISLPDLPDPPLARPEDAAILRSIAPLYLALELEQTGLLKAGSTLAGLYASGGLRLAPGASADLLMQYHRDYERRLPTDDRYASYLRLFGTAPKDAAPYAAPNAVNTGFDEAMLALAEAMHHYANTSPLHGQMTTAQRQIRNAARRLAENLVMRGGGATGFIAEETLKQISTVISLFKAPDIQAALGARGLWEAVAQANAWGGMQPRRHALGVSASARNHLARARAGVALIGWLGERAADLFGVGLLHLERNDPILAQGTAWLEATLSLLTSQEDGSYGF